MSTSKRNLRMTSMVGLATILLASMGVVSAVALGKGKPSAAPSESTTTQSGGSATTSDVTTTEAPSKVLVCHRTHSKKKPFHTISVSAKAVPAHLAHGDTLGACVLASGSNSSGPNGHGHGNGNGHSK